jgi:uncharacterized protein (TIGR03067 family)
MRVKMLALVVVGLLVAADEPKGDSKRDLEEMQGEWSMVSGERDGQAIPDEIAHSLKRIVKGDHFTAKRNDETFGAGTFKIDATKSPKTMDLTLSEGRQAGHAIPAIYELHGDTMRICYGSPDKPRPTEFNAKAGSGQTCSTYKRAKK